MDTTELGFAPRARGFPLLMLCVAKTKTAWALYGVPLLSTNVPQPGGQAVLESHIPSALTASIPPSTLAPSSWNADRLSVSLPTGRGHHFSFVILENLMLPS